ncbi:MAG: hypothetical protein EOO87_02445 [Pedobacter sp.]|nr:MAG: hypothetical protein EOO87_02445 [Pedobacter sp.]
MNFVKNTSSILALIFFGLLGCKNANKVDDIKSIRSTIGLKAVQEKLITAFGADKLVYSVTIMAKDHMNDEFMYADISFLEKGVDMSQDLIILPEEKINSAKSKTIQNPLVLKNKQGAVALRDLKFEEIEEKVKQGEALIPADYEDFHLYRWVYNIDNDKNITADFTLEAARKGEKSETKGRMEISNYYEMNFKMDENGVVRIAD